VTGEVKFRVSLGKELQKLFRFIGVGDGFAEAVESQTIDALLAGCFNQVEKKKTLFGTGQVGQSRKIKGFEKGKVTPPIEDS
jgi:hypothetical protein